MLADGNAEWTGARRNEGQIHFLRPDFGRLSGRYRYVKKL